MHPVLVTPGSSGFIEPCVAPFGVRARKRIVVGLDSLGSSGGQPGLASNLEAHFTARFGNAGSGLVPLDQDTIGRRLAGGDYGRSAGFTEIATLPWIDPRRRRSLFGKGLACFNEVTDDSLATDYLLLSGAAEDVHCVDLYFEWSSVGQSFRVRQWPTEVLTNGLYIRQADFPEIGVVHKLTFLLDVGGTYTGKGINVERATCCGSDLFFWAVEFHGPATGRDGVQVLDLGTASAGAADWFSLDDARMRKWAQIVQADVFILTAGVNDRGSAPQNDLEARANAASFGAHVNQIINRLQSSARTDVLVVRPPDPADAATTAIRYYDTVLQAAAWAQGCAFLDERDALGDFAAANTAGYVSVDGVHPSTLGNAKRAEALAAKLAKFGS